MDDATCMMTPEELRAELNRPRQGWNVRGRVRRRALVSVLPIRPGVREKKWVKVKYLGQCLNCADRKNNELLVEVPLDRIRKYLEDMKKTEVVDNP